MFVYRNILRYAVAIEIRCHRAIFWYIRCTCARALVRARTCAVRACTCAVCVLKKSWYGDPHYPQPLCNHFINTWRPSVKVLITRMARYAARLASPDNGFWVGRHAISSASDRKLEASEFSRDRISMDRPLRLCMGSVWKRRGNFETCLRGAHRADNFARARTCTHVRARARGMISGILRAQIF